MPTHVALHSKAPTATAPCRRSSCFAATLSSTRPRCDAVCCSVMQCVAECCSVCHAGDPLASLQHSAEQGPGVLQCVAVYCSVLQCVAVCCSVLQCVQWSRSFCIAASKQRKARVCCSVLQCVAVYCSVLQCVAVCCIRCSMLQCVAVCCSVLQCVAVCCKPNDPGELRHHITSQQCKARGGWGWVCGWVGRATGEIVGACVQERERYKAGKRRKIMRGTVRERERERERVRVHIGRNWASGLMLCMRIRTYEFFV